MKTLKTILYIAAVLLVCRIAFGLIGAGNEVAATKARPINVKTPAEQCVNIAKVTEDFGTDRDQGITEAAQREEMLPLHVSAERREMLETILGSVYAHANVSPDELRTIAYQQCMQAFTEGALTN